MAGVGSNLVGVRSNKAGGARGGVKHSMCWIKQTKWDKCQAMFLELNQVVLIRYGLLIITRPLDRPRSFSN